ncbi:MAG: hypothetical protein SF053_06305 [Bacteroidia bacterium]|jgi:hypothetical protein|nr:hypothetical protein [Bacteroidia bacterium]
MLHHLEPLLDMLLIVFWGTFFMAALISAWFMAPDPVTFVQPLDDDDPVYLLEQQA